MHVTAADEKKIAIHDVNNNDGISTHNPIIEAPTVKFNCFDQACITNIRNGFYSLP